VGDPVDIFRCSVIVGGNGGRTATPKPNGRAPANPQVLIGSGVSPGVHFSSSLVSPPSKLCYHIFSCTIKTIKHLQTCGAVRV
jgi:hypothetical protein